MSNPFNVGDRVRRISGIVGGSMPPGSEWIVSQVRNHLTIHVQNDPSGTNANRMAQYFELITPGEEGPPVVQAPQEEITLYTIIYKIGRGTPRSRGYIDEAETLDARREFERSGYTILGMKKIKVRI